MKLYTEEQIRMLDINLEGTTIDEVINCLTPIYITTSKEIDKDKELKEWIETWSLGYNSGWDNCMKKFKQEEQQAKEIEKQQKKDTKTMEKLIESNRKFDEKNNNSIKYNPNDRSEDNPNVTNFFI